MESGSRLKTGRDSRRLQLPEDVGNAGRSRRLQDPRPAPPPSPLGRLGGLEVRLAATPDELRRALELRYEVFYEEMAACADAGMRALRLDFDGFDQVCDHAIVVDRHAAGDRLPREPRIVATARLIRQEIARRQGGFYTEREYEVQPLLDRHSGLRFLELGRSCVVKEYRHKRTLELLWHGIWAYALAHRVDAMFGCASLAGTDPDRLALPLSFLHHHARAPAEWCVRAREELRVEMNRLPVSAVDHRAAMRSLPPLIKGYLRLGGHVGDGAVVDRQFATTDVCIVLPVATVNRRYLSHFGADAGRYAA